VNSQDPFSFIAHSHKLLQILVARRSWFHTAKAELRSSDLLVMRFLCWLKRCFALVATSASLLVPAFGQTAAISYPTRIIHFIVPFAPGASTDIVARLFGQKLSAAWEQPIVVENRGGAGGGIGAEQVVRSEPDGYTLMVTNQGPSILNAMLRKGSSYAVDDLAPVIEFGYSPLIVVANFQFPPNNIKELVAFAKANPGKVTIGSSGTNSNVHIALEIFKAVTGTDIVHVPYRGTGPSLSDVVAGNINGAYTTTVSAEGLIKAGRVKVLGVAGAKRLDIIPDVATYAEQGIVGADAAVWIGLVAPAKTPKPILDKINRDANASLQKPDVRERFAQWGLEVEGGTAERFNVAIKAEVERVDRLIKSGALKVE
jgi:tripartite-type tricarboxylate transporter receptor subunit TctC